MTETVAIFVFPEVEVLDFAGPFQVFSTAARVAARNTPDGPAPCRVFTVSASPEPVRTRGGLSIQPDWHFTNHPPADLLIIPGGVVDAEMDNPVVLEWIRRSSATAKLTASVCTGAFLLARAGILRRGRVTTHWENAADLASRYPELEVVEDCRWADQGRYLTSAGISAGIDMSLHLVERRFGRELAEATARQMDFDWRR
ncbi:MAG: DJ-1/PfpI family protein [Pseudohongiellaceae bacterium]